MVFSDYCQFSFRQMFRTHLSSGAGTMGQLVADVLSGVILLQEIKKKIQLPE
jgi:hypothetical protein